MDPLVKVDPITQGEPPCTISNFNLEQVAYVLAVHKSSNYFAHACFGVSAFRVRELFLKCLQLLCFFV